MAIGTPQLIDTVDSGHVNGDTLTLTVGAGGVPAGAAIVVAVHCGGPAGAITITDDASNTYSEAVADTAHGVTNLAWHMHYAENVSALGPGDTITITTTNSVLLRIATAAYVTGIATSSALDQTTVAEGDSPTPSSGNLTTTTADQILFGSFAAENVSTTFTEDGDFTALEAHQYSADSARWLTLSYHILSSTGTHAHAPSLGDSGQWTDGLASFKAAAVAGGDPEGPLIGGKLIRGGLLRGGRLVG